MTAPCVGDLVEFEVTSRGKATKLQGKLTRIDGAIAWVMVSSARFAVAYSALRKVEEDA